MRLIFLRHGQDDDRYRGGWSSLGLLEEGRGQAMCVARYFCVQTEYNITEILSSDLPRAMETARYLSDTLNLPIQPEPQLRETNNGQLAGMRNEEALIQYPGLYFSSLEMEEPYPGGESPKDFYLRIKTWFEGFLRQSQARQGDILLVTHGGVIDVIYHLVNKLEWTNKKRPFPTGKCSIHVLNVDTMTFETENKIVW